MSKRNNKAFTLIELIGVLVIMAITALIVTPLVLNIIRKARVSSDRRSVDAYGRSIELAITSYLLDTGKFPTEVSQLTIEYSGNKVVCTTTQINSDSSVYLSGCTVAGRSTGDYTYGSDKTPQTPTYTSYQVGDEVTYNSINYYVIKDSDATEDSVTLLKAEPLSAEEITTYSARTGTQTNGSGGMQYHSNSNVYSTSYVKITVDAWTSAQAPLASESRLITIDEVSSLGYEWKQTCPTCEKSLEKSENTPGWIYNTNYWYWTISSYNESLSLVFVVAGDGGISYAEAYIGGKYILGDSHGVVRPVIVLDKSVLTSS